MGVFGAVFSDVFDFVEVWRKIEKSRGVQARAPKSRVGGVRNPSNIDEKSYRKWDAKLKLKIMRK